MGENDARPQRIDELDCLRAESVSGVYKHSIPQGSRECAISEGVEAGGTIAGTNPAPQMPSARAGISNYTSMCRQYSWTRNCQEDTCSVRTEHADNVAPLQLGERGSDSRGRIDDSVTVFLSHSRQPLLLPPELHAPHAPGK